MSFGNRTQSTDHSEQTARSTQPAQRSTSYEESMPRRSQMGRTWPSIERAEEHFGIQIPDESTLQRLEINEQKYGRETHEWIAEGMPADLMGSPRDMEAFRQRQSERPPEVPTDIERRNRRSVLRSEKAAGETSPAGETGVPDPVRDVISSTGRSLDGSIQRAMEDRMGDSFGDVRIHTGSTAAEACESINARAFTVGNHIAFNSGEYDPSSPESQHVLAHELTHVRQQTQGAVSMLPQENVELEVDPDPALEREAEEAAQQAMADGPVVINRMGCEMQIQRSTKGDSEFVTKDEVLDIVENYHRGRTEHHAEQDPLEQGETRQTPQGKTDQSTAEQDSDQSLLGRIKGVGGNIKDAVEENFGGDKGKRNIAHGTVAGTVAAGTIAATVLSGGTVGPIAASATVAGSTMAPALRGTAADAVGNENEVPLSDQELEKVAQEVEKIRNNTDAKIDSQDVVESQR